MSRLTPILIMAAILFAGTADAGDGFIVRERVRSSAAEVSFDFKEGKFVDVVEHIAKLSGKNIVIDGKIEDTPTGRGEVASCPRHGMSADRSRHRRGR